MIFFVGPLPPPVHGFSAINAKMLSRLQLDGSVKVFDLSPAAGLIRFLLGYIFLVFTFAFSLVVFRPSCVYMGLSGGVRQLLDAVFVVFARLFGVPLYVHHHSYAYVNSTFWYSKFIFWLLRDSAHIVLCLDMGEHLVTKYGLNREKVFPLSNSAFVEDAGASFLLRKEERGESISIGFLSNITREKGIFDFFDLIAALNARGVPVDGVIAGPVDPLIFSEFSERLMLFDNIRHLGAVYGREKAEFFSSIDLLAFPTRYVNEAEPVTIIEAQSFGVPVIAVRRGCIGCMIPESAGLIVDDAFSFVEDAVAQILAFKEKPELLVERKYESRKFYEISSAANVCALNQLVADMSGAPRPK